MRRCRLLLIVRKPGEQWGRQHRGNLDTQGLQEKSCRKPIKQLDA